MIAKAELVADLPASPVELILCRRMIERLHRGVVA
jgi:hypothetical protein